MKRGAVWILIGLLLTAACLKDGFDDGATTSSNTSSGDEGSKPLTIVNRNVHNLINEVEDDTKAKFEQTDADYDEHRKAVGKVLAQLDADVVLLQEVEHAKVLDELNDELDGRYPHRSLIDANDPRGIDNAVLSKIPFDKVVSHQGDFFTKAGTKDPKYIFARDCVEVHLTFNGRAIALLNVHFKSKENDNPDKRLAEAQHARKLADDITASAPDTGIVILGDFNDLPGSSPYTAVVGSQPNEYSNAAVQVPSDDQWTFLYKGTKELVDQQMANPIMSAMLVPDSVRIIHSSDVDEASDHAPVLATYAVK